MEKEAESGLARPETPPNRFAFSKRNSLIGLALLLALGLGVLSTLAFQALSLGSPPSQLLNFRDKVLAAVFEITCNLDLSGSGWGVELGNEQFIVTAAHVVEDCREDGSLYAINEKAGYVDIDIVAFDDSYWSHYGIGADLALLSVSKWIPTLGMSADEAEVGQWVAIFGFPFDSQGDSFRTMAAGAVTGISREGLVITDAPINNGNSGGPMVDKLGRVIGTVFASDPPEEFENLGFAQSLKMHCWSVFVCDDKGTPLAPFNE